MDYFKESLSLHRKLVGKIETCNKAEVNTIDDLSTVYSPGVAEPCSYIHQHPESVYELTMKANTVAVVTDGSSVLGLGDIGPEAALPVMEGKAMLFKKLAGINAIPLCLNTKDTEQIIQTVQNIAPAYGGINLEDISAPRCFEIEDRLQEIGIPVFHDDQHGTAIVTLSGIINACKLLDKQIGDLKVVINGSGAAGVAIAKLLGCIESTPGFCEPVSEILVCDSKGIINGDRANLSPVKRDLLSFTNLHNKTGNLSEALEDADVFIGVSKGNLLTGDDVKRMAHSPMIFALANPTPEIMPEEAKAAGAKFVATGRSDYPNQINNVLVFPGIFKAALQMRARQITPEMKLSAAFALADMVEKPTEDHVVVSSLEPHVAQEVTELLTKACGKTTSS